MKFPSRPPNSPSSKGRAGSSLCVFPLSSPASYQEHLCLMTASDIRTCVRVKVDFRLCTIPARVLPKQFIQHGFSVTHAACRLNAERSHKRDGFSSSLVVIVFLAPSLFVCSWRNFQQSVSRMKNLHGHAGIIITRSTPHPCLVRSIQACMPETLGRRKKN